ncbi:hypothetical protein EHEL_080780 [Encephalitozoon hellem ATCC 50504]|uniref:VCX1-like calcium ion transporter n=1 Tax=Encephalitozoon hellem TaxID=27973 RepID=A0A9Q9CAS2_ENCHE|nr:uncharacterized protein EHEL_080780 [Encephalitozoon hellem ATCC 50504]AFM98780.2 hypothetical protein EHEL_080780 [Encephalitozoon hellem ATCC 50504]UTX43757.1 vacuolar calcium ion transporter [Encephalitozoon hellem]WEL39235.1 VCX1-like calcium ion transporter [Encephalitozoon hellem]
MLSKPLELFFEVSSAPHTIIYIVFWFAALTFLNIFYTREYHVKIMKHITKKIRNIFIQALVLCFLNSIPKIILMVNLYRNSSIQVFASAISGTTQISMAISLALVLILAKTNCFVHHISFYKDILFLEASHLLLLIMFSNATDALTVPLMALGVFSTFLFNTFSLPPYISQVSNSSDEEVISSHAQPPSPSLTLYPFRLIFNLLFLDPSHISPSSSKKTPYTIVLSPVINFLIGAMYLRMDMRRFELLLSLACSFLLGLLLYMMARKRILSTLSCLYSLAASILFFSIIMESFVSLSMHISNATGLGAQFLSGTFLSLQCNLTEIVTCLSYTGNEMLIVSSCSILYTHMYNTLLFFPVAKLLLGKTGAYAQSHNISNAPFVYFSYVFILAEIKVIFVNYLLRHHKLTKDLGYTLIAIYVLFIIGFAMEGKTHLCK